MVYVERNQKGEIISLCKNAETPGMECKLSVDTEILDFFDSVGSCSERFQLLASTDATTARIVEDVVDLLVSKNLIMFTELPEEAQQKIRARKRIRKDIDQESIIVDDIL